MAAIVSRWARRVFRRRHLRHPIRAAGLLLALLSLRLSRFGKALNRRTRGSRLHIRKMVYAPIVNRSLKRIQRDNVDRCWCGGALDPFEFHESYGVCRDCGCYVNRRPPAAREIEKIYSADCYWGAIAKMRGWTTLEKRAATYRKDGRLDHWLRLVEKFGPGRGVVVEVGCAPGVLLAELKDRGYEVVGVEANREVSDWITNNLGVEVKAGVFPSPSIELPRCELFIGLDVLEHVGVPEQFLKEAARLLKPGGVAIIQSPIDRYDTEQPLDGKPGVVFDDIEHLYIYTDRSMRELARRAALIQVSFEEEPWRIGHEICVFRKPEQVEAD